MRGKKLTVTFKEYKKTTKTQSENYRHRKK